MGAQGKLLSTEWTVFRKSFTLPHVLSVRKMKGKRREIRWVSDLNLLNQYICKSCYQDVTRMLPRPEILQLKYPKLYIPLALLLDFIGPLSSQKMNVFQ